VAVSEENVRIADPAASGLEIQDVVSLGLHTLLLSGELDIVSGGELEAVVRQLCASGSGGVVIDLSKLDFIDSTGIHAIMLAGKLCEHHGRKFGLIAGPKNIQRVFEITGLDKVLPFSEVEG
jgi:anti-sigma B factor antagonist